MKHGATEYVAEYTVSVVKIADDEGEGSHHWERWAIFARSNLQPVLMSILMINQDKCAFILDPVRREIARITLKDSLKMDVFNQHVLMRWLQKLPQR